MNPEMVERTPHPGPLPIGSADSADAERGKRSQLSGEATVGCCSKTREFYELIQRLFLLPWGEGQDENSPKFLSRFEPPNRRRSAEHPLGPSKMGIQQRAEQVLGAPVHGEGERGANFQRVQQSQLSQL
jgi:hypothetical protein